MRSALARAVSGPRSKWAVVGTWLVLAIGLGSLGGKLDDRLDDQVATPSSLPADAESARVADVLANRFEGGEPFVTILVYRRDGGLTDADRSKVLDDARRAAAVEHSGPALVPFGADATPGLVSADGAVAFTVLPLLTPAADLRTEALDELREITGRGGGGLAVRITGASALQSDLTTALEAVDLPLLIATAALVLLILIAIYRSPVIPLIPLLVVGISVVIARGLIYLYAEVADVTVDRTALSLLAVLMFGAGTDYCLLMVARYTTNLRRIADRHEALAAAIPRAAPAIAASGITVVGAMLTLLVARLETTQILGPVNAIGIAVVLIASLTLLPALLAIAGRPGFWPSRRAVELEPAAGDRPEPRLLPGLRPLPDGLRGSAEAAGVVRSREPFWGRLGMLVLGRPVLALCVSAALLGAGALGTLNYREDVNQLIMFREDNDSTEGFDLLRAGFPEGALVPTTILVSSQDNPVEQPVAQIGERIAGIDGVAGVSEITNRSRDGRAATFSVTFADDPFGDAALDRVELIRSELARAGPGVTALAGDGTALRLDYREAASGDQERVVPLVLAVILVTLIVLLRALVAPLYLLATVVVSFFSALGISLVAFEVLFDHPTVDPAYPLLCFIFLVALGIDYNIFLMSAVREEAAEHGTRPAILRAIRGTGPVITSAGIVLAGTFAVLTSLPLLILFEIGFTVALGVLIDTFVVRTITVPAIAWLLGDRNWWPSSPAGPRAGRRSRAGARTAWRSGVARPGPSRAP